MLWSKQLETGVAIIDDQHKELFRRIDLLLDNKQPDRVKTTLDFLDEYIVKHFTDEQNIHARSNYPKAAPHREYHNSFIASFRALKSKYEKEGATLANNLAVNKTVIGWLTNHILVQDKEFAVWLASHS